MTSGFDIKYQSETMFTVFHDGKEIAWCQWSPVYDMWRVIMLSDNHVHHLENIDQIFRICTDEIGVDFE
jgi:hypothetical protein